MYFLFALLSGILTAVMIVSNGELTSHFGVYLATVIIHILGLILVTFILFIRGEKPLAKKLPWYFYLGGALGVAVTSFSNLAFGRISVSAILALNLLGQSFASIVIDQFGFMNMPKHPFKKNKLLGLIIVCIGITFMITEFELLAVLLSFLAGVTLVISRTFNARLTGNTSVMISTFFNYLVGLGVGVIVMMVFGRNELSITEITFSPNLFIYLGGIISVGTVLISNIIVGKIPAFYMTLFLFVGQVVMGVILDSVLVGDFSMNNLIGAFFVGMGMFSNLLLDKKPETTL